jgi:upstream activation factor subunit UAF30
MSRITARERKLQKPSKELAMIVGEEPMVLSEARNRVWNYIKQNRLQDPADRRIIKADTKLKDVFKRSEVSVLHFVHLLKPHLKFPTITWEGEIYEN